MTEQKISRILETLDKTYGTSKEGFFYLEKWQLLIAIMLSAQSTDKQVDEVLPVLWKTFPDLQAVVDKPVLTIEQCIKSVGLYKSKANNMKKCCTQILEEYHGEVPTQLEELLKLAGVGRKTATLFLADAYGIPGVTVDTHVLRVSRRLGLASGKTPVQVEQELMKVLPIEHWNRINFQLICHGRGTCTARKCRCGNCVLAQWCEKIPIGDCPQ